MLQLKKKTDSEYFGNSVSNKHRNPEVDLTAMYKNALIIIPQSDWIANGMLYFYFTRFRKFQRCNIPGYQDSDCE